MPAVNSAVIAALLSKRDQCRKAMLSAEADGVLKNRRQSGVATVWVDYDERSWQVLKAEERKRQALMVFCATMPESGQHTVMILGARGGKILGSVINGNWTD